MDFSEQYLTYNEYLALGGTLDQMPFNLLEFRARQNVDKYTFGRLKDLDSQIQEVKLCIYELINTINSYDAFKGANKGIASENIDGYSISYATPSTNITDAQESEIKGIVKEYLVDCKLEDGTPYMYCGAK